jgi:hypothetical protein
MNRRYFLGATALCLLSTASRSDPLSEDGKKHLNHAWQLPHNAYIELWPSQLGLDIYQVLQAIEDWVIPSSSSVILRFQDDVFVHKKPVIFQHRYGKQISIIGNILRPDLCRFEWSGPNEAFYVNAGNILGLIDGITVNHTTKKNRGLGSAFLADNGGIVFCGPNVRVHNFYYGFQARFGGVIQCEGTLSSGAGDANYFAFNGGHISAPRAQAHGAKDGDLGSGFVAEYGGTINAVDAFASRNAFCGFTALSNGSIRAYRSRATYNGKAGYYVNTGGVIIAHDATATSNCGQGVWRHDDNEAFEANHFNDTNNSISSNLCTGEVSYD